MNKFWKWIASSFEGSDNKASSRRLAAFTYILLTIALLVIINIICLLYLYNHLKKNLQETMEILNYLKNILEVILVLILTLFGINVVQTLAELKKGFSNFSLTKETTTETTKETTTAATSEVDKEPIEPPTKL